MARLIFENLSIEDAEILAHWYEGQGEQDASIWFECQADKYAPCADVGNPGWLKIDHEKQEVVMRLRQ